MDDGVELKQLTVGVDSVGLGVGAGLVSAIVLMAISAASVVIVLIIYSLSIVSGCLVVIAGQPLWQSKEKFSLEFWGLFLTFSSGNSGAKFSKQVSIAPSNWAA
jgi:hypothetical protein